MRPRYPLYFMKNLEPPNPFCVEYQHALENLEIFTLGGENPQAARQFDLKTHWYQSSLTKEDLKTEKPKCLVTNLDKEEKCTDKWIPVNPELISRSSIEETKRKKADRWVWFERNTRSNQGSTLTEMLPIIGRVVRVSPPNLNTAPSLPPVITTMPEKCYPKVWSATTRFADEFTLANGRPYF